MNFYTPNDTFDNYQGIQTKEREITKALTENHPAFTATRVSARKHENFSNMSAEERWNYSQKIKQLQSLINAIQTDIDANISSGFTLDEVLEVLNIRRTMHRK